MLKKKLFIYSMKKIINKLAFGKKKNVSKQWLMPGDKVMPI